MLREVLTVSALILAVLLVRAIFKNRVPKRMVYALWLVVLVKLCLPGTLVSLPILPAEETAAPVQRVELPAQTAPVVLQPAQAVVQPQVSAQQPVSPAQEAAEPAAKPLTAMQIFQIIWAGGSALLGLWLLSTWLVFTIRLHKSRRFLGRQGGTRIYVSSAVKSPCLAGLAPAVYLTEDVLQTDSTELILRHELTHLRHLDLPVVTLPDGGCDCLLVEPVYLACCGLLQARRRAGVRRGCRGRAFGRTAPCLRAGDSGAGPAQSGGPEPRRASGQGADSVPDEKTAHKRSVCHSGAAAHRVCSWVLDYGADAAENGGNHAAEENTDSSGRNNDEYHAAGGCMAGSKSSD